MSLVDNENFYIREFVIYYKNKRFVCFKYDHKIHHRIVDDNK